MASRRALVVAINDYPGSANDLPSCVEDAKGVTELLQSEPFLGNSYLHGRRSHDQNCHGWIPLAVREKHAGGRDTRDSRGSLSLLLKRSWIPR
jgi:hypothetical protein